MNRAFLAIAVAALAGCAQVGPPTTGQTRIDDIVPQKTAGLVIDYTLPPDALGAHDSQLTAVLAKTGALAARQPQPVVITVSALAQDFHYLNQSILDGIPARRLRALHIENVTVGACQPYGVRVHTAQ